MKRDAKKTKARSLKTLSDTELAGVNGGKDVIPGVRGSGGGTGSPTTIDRTN